MRRALRARKQNRGKVQISKLKCQNSTTQPPAAAGDATKILHKSAITARASREKVEQEKVESRAGDHPDDVPAGDAEATQTAPRPLPGSVKFRRKPLVSKELILQTESDKVESGEEERMPKNGSSSSLT